MIMMMVVMKKKRAIHMKTNIHMISRWILLRIMNVSDKISWENRIHFTFNNFSEYRTVYEIIWKNMMEPDWPQIWI
jgi:hypothetical protein